MIIGGVRAFIHGML